MLDTLDEKQKKYFIWVIVLFVIVLVLAGLVMAMRRRRQQKATFGAGIYGGAESPGELSAEEESRASSAEDGSESFAVEDVIDTGLEDYNPSTNMTNFIVNSA